MRKFCLATLALLLVCECAQSPFLRRSSNNNLPIYTTREEGLTCIHFLTTGDTLRNDVGRVYSLHVTNGITDTLPDLKNVLKEFFPEYDTTPEKGIKCTLYPDLVKPYLTKPDAKPDTSNSHRQI